MFFFQIVQGYTYSNCSPLVDWNSFYTSKFIKELMFYPVDVSWDLCLATVEALALCICSA